MITQYPDFDISETSNRYGEMRCIIYVPSYSLKAKDELLITLPNGKKFHVPNGKCIDIKPVNTPIKDR